MQKNTTNSLLKSIIKKVNSLCEGKNYPPILLHYLYLITYGMISVYGTEYCDLIYSVIQKNEIFIGLPALKKKKEATINSCTEEFIQEEKEAFVLQTVTKKEDVYSLQKQIYILHDFENDSKINPIFILEFIAHELNHILTSVKRNFFYLNGGLACRCGLFRYVLSKKENAYTSGKILSEVINTLQTEDIIKEILSIDYHEVEHVGVRSILEVLSSLNPTTYASVGYANETSLYRDLYSIPLYKNFINANILEGDIDAIIKDFDETVGANAYLEFTTLYDTFNKKLTEGRKKDWQTQDIETSSTLARETKRFISLYKEKKYPSMKWS